MALMSIKAECEDLDAPELRRKGLCTLWRPHYRVYFLTHNHHSHISLLRIRVRKNQRPGMHILSQKQDLLI